MGLLPDTYNCGLRMRRECRERFPRHRLQRKLLVSDPGMHHGTCVTHVPWCISGSLTRGGGENVPGIPGACASRNCTYLARGPWLLQSNVDVPTVSIILNFCSHWNIYFFIQNFFQKTFCCDILICYSLRIHTYAEQKSVLNDRLKFSYWHFL